MPMDLILPKIRTLRRAVSLQLIRRWLNLYSHGRTSTKKPGFLAHLRVRTKYFRKKTRFLGSMRHSYSTFQVSEVQRNRVS